MIRKKVNRQARIIWGATVDQKYDGTVEILIIATGLRKPGSLMFEGKEKTGDIDIVS